MVASAHVVKTSAARPSDERRDINSGSVSAGNTFGNTDARKEQTHGLDR
jgi:hypothetical protein